MHRIGVLSLVSLIMLLAAMLAASSASGTALCEINEDPCSGEYTVGPPLDLELAQIGEPGLLKGGSLEVKCTASTVKGELDEETSEGLAGEVSALSFGGCSSKGSGCTQTADRLPYKLEAKETEEGDGTLTLSSGGSGNPRFKVQCGEIKCTYGGEKITLQAAGGEPATDSASKLSLAKEEGTLLVCGSSAAWSIEHEIAEYESLFVVANGLPTLLCEGEPQGKLNKDNEEYLECPNGKRYAGKIAGALAKTTSAQFVSKAGIGTITCTESALAGKFDSNGMSVPKEGVTAWTFTSAGGACSSELGTKPPVTVTMTSLPYSKSRFNYLRPTPAQGSFSPQREAGALPKLTLSYEKKTCEYVVKSIVNSSFYNGDAKTSSLLSLGIVWSWWNGAGCQAETDMAAVFAITKDGGGNLYVSER